MDVVVADIVPKFGIFLLRSWEKRVGGTLQMDLSFETIPIFQGEYRRLYRGVQLALLISENNNRTNHPVYAVEGDFGILYVAFE